MLDSGSFMSLARQDLVTVNTISYNQHVDILCVHGDKHPCPTAELNVTINDQPYLLIVWVVEKMPVALLLGWDLPVLFDLLSKTDCGLEGNS